MDKSNPIFTYLETMTESEIKNVVKKLGFNRLRNLGSMISKIAEFFFNLDQNSPQKSLEKYLNGELPEHDMTLKATRKRKSESMSGPSIKKTKTGLEEVIKNQEQLKEKRKTRLDSIAKKEDASSLFVENPIIEAGIKFKEELARWKQEEACKICEESWFDQENATKGPNVGVCKRCRHDKNKEVPTFSRENEMIPGEQPECLAILNNIEVGAIRIIIPYMNVFKNKAGGRSFKGHSISFFQDVESLAKNLPEKLPRPVDELQIILMKESKVTGKKREFIANGSRIRAALEWLIKNCPDYKDIKIDEENLAQYPSNGGKIDIQTFEEKDNENTEDQKTENEERESSK